MKNLLYFVILFCCPLVFIACSDSKEEFDSMPYSFRLGGEIWNETDGLKADETALYGIEVLYADGSPYAYGLFDDLGKAKIKLLKEKQFTFRVVVVPNGQKLCHDIHSTATERYLDRFKEIYTLTSDDYCFWGNEFVYDTHVHFRYFRVPEKSYYYRIFTGYCSDFDRNAGNEIVIDMKAMFGEIVYRLNADIGDYVKELRVIGRLVSDTDPMDAEPIPSFDELKGQLGYSVDGFYMESGFRDAEGFYYSFRDWDDCFVRIPDDYEMSIRVIIQYQNMKKDILGERASPVLSMKRHETLVFNVLPLE
jgi:hypothetical protein